MFVPEGNDAALPMMFLLWLVWGSWPSARKQGGCDNVNFGLTFIFVQVLVSLLVCFTMGTISLRDTRHFDEEMFHRKFMTELREKTNGILVSWTAGALLCCGDFLMASAIDLLGLAVACPVGFGLALTYGTALNYLIEPRSDPKLLFPGLACCLAGMICDAASHYVPRSKGPAESAAENQGGAAQDILTGTAEANVERVQIKQLKQLKQLTQLKQPKSGASVSPFGTECCPVWSCLMFGEPPKSFPKGLPEFDLRRSAADDEMPTHIMPEVDEETERPKLSRFIVFLPLTGGLFCGSHGPISTAAATILDLSPFSILMAFMIGQLCMIFPLVCAYSWLTAKQDLPLRQIPCSIWKGYLTSVRTDRKALLWNSVAGIDVALGYFFFFVGSPVVSRAVGFIFGCSSLLLSVLMGIFFFKELHGKSCRQKVLCLTGISLLIAAMGLMCAASLEQESFDPSE